MSELTVVLAISTWLFFGVYGVVKMWKFLGVPPSPVIWIAMLLTSLLAVFGPVFMQAVYETIIEHLEKRRCNGR